MNRNAFLEKIDQLRGTPIEAGSRAVVFVFSDGAQHLVQIWTIECLEGEHVKYIEVHCDPHSSEMFVKYECIKDVVAYSDDDQSRPAS